MHLVAEIIFIFLIVYLTGSSSIELRSARFFISQEVPKELPNPIF